MPRGRFISKAISLDEKVNALSDDTARLLFTWLIAHLDCEGRLHGDALTVKSIIFPRRPIRPQKVEKYLIELEKNGLIVRYSCNGNTYLVAPHFSKHQVGLQKSKEAQSQIPPPSPELLQSYSRKSPPQVKVKVKVKVKAKVEGATASFNTYKEKLVNTYPELNVEEEWEKCQIWFRDNKKTIKSPSLALGNWCSKAMEIRRDSQGGDNHGAHRSNTKHAGTKLPQKYNEEAFPYYPEFAAEHEADRTSTAEPQG